MMKQSAYDILGVNREASDEQIRSAYTGMIKAFPPERDPEQFRSIRQAYESLRDKKSRLRYELFTLPSVDLEQLMDQCLQTDQVLPLKPAHLNRLMREGIETITENHMQKQDDGKQ